MAETLFTVGQYVEKFNQISAQSLPCGPILQSPGLAVHIRKRHPALVPKIDLIPEIICCPNYIGVNPSEPNSIELVKVFDQNLKVCIKLDQKDGYLYVASLYNMTQAKVDKHLQNGRLKPYK